MLKILKWLIGLPLVVGLRTFLSLSSSSPPRPCNYFVPMLLSGWVEMYCFLYTAMVLHNSVLSYLQDVKKTAIKKWIKKEVLGLAAAYITRFKFAFFSQKGLQRLSVNIQTGTCIWFYRSPSPRGDIPRTAMTFAA